MTYNLFPDCREWGLKRPLIYEYEVPDSTWIPPIDIFGIDVDDPFFLSQLDQWLSANRHKTHHWQQRRFNEQVLIDADRGFTVCGKPVQKHRLIPHLTPGWEINLDGYRQQQEYNPIFLVEIDGVPVAFGGLFLDKKASHRQVPHPRIEREKGEEINIDQVGTVFFKFLADQVKNLPDQFVSIPAWRRSNGDLINHRIWFPVPTSAYLVFPREAVNQFFLNWLIDQIKNLSTLRTQANQLWTTRRHARCVSNWLSHLRGEVQIKVARGVLGIAVEFVDRTWSKVEPVHFPRFLSDSPGCRSLCRTLDLPQEERYRWLTEIGLYDRKMPVLDGHLNYFLGHSHLVGRRIRSRPDEVVFRVSRIPLQRIKLLEVVNKFGIEVESDKG